MKRSRDFLTLAALCTAALAALPAFAQQDNAAEGTEESTQPPIRQRIMDEFDTDGDGQLSDEESRVARETMQAQRADNESETETQAVSPEARAQAGRRGRGRRGRGGRGRGFPGRGGLGPVLAQFDTNNDGRLSAAEIEAAPPEARPRLRQFAAQLEEVEPDPPFADRGRRGGRDGRGRRGGRGGPPTDQLLRDRRPPLDPNALFDWFDLNEDGTLDRQEFARVAAALRPTRVRLTDGDRPRTDDGDEESVDAEPPDDAPAFGRRGRGAGRRGQGFFGGGRGRGGFGSGRGRIGPGGPRRGRPPAEAPNEDANESEAPAADASATVARSIVVKGV